MPGLLPINENGDAPTAEEDKSNRGSYMETNSYTESIPPNAGNSMRRRPSDLRSNLLKHKQLWQKAAKIVKDGSNLEHRRRSILPIEDICVTDLLPKCSQSSSLGEDDDEETSLGAEQMAETVVSAESHYPGSLAHAKVVPLTSTDIEKGVKPYLRPARKIFGFIFPRIPTQFTMCLNESLYQRYYGNKRKRTMLMVNILYSILALSLYIIKILPISSDTASLSITYILRETIITVLMLAFHITVSIFINRANSHNQLLVWAYTTWFLLLLHTQISPITSFADYLSLASKDTTIKWYSIGTWQTALAVSLPFVFLSVIPLSRIIALAIAVLVVHLITAGAMCGITNISGLSKVKLLRCYNNLTGETKQFTLL